MFSILPRVALALLLAALAAGCGLKDDLYLPEPDTQDTETRGEGTENGQDEDGDEANT